nr:uncharacterized protein LOC109186197 [Ipomoea trifida]
MVISRVFFCSIIIIVLGLLFLLLPAHNHHHHHGSVGFFGGYPDHDHHHISTGVLRRMRKMIAAIPHTSPTSPGNLKKPYVHLASLGTTKNTSLDGTTDDVMTKTKMGISSTGLVAMPPRRRRRRLISASPSNSQPSSGY